MNLFGRGRVLDQLKQAIAKHDFARRRGKVFTNLEGFLISQSDDQITVIRFKIPNQVLKPSNKAFTFGLRRKAQCLRIRCQKVGRTEHINNLLAEEFQAPLFTVIHRVDRRNRFAHRIGVHKVLLLDKVKIGVRFPHLMTKSTVRRRRINRRLQFALDEQMLRLNIVFDGFTPERDLLFDDLTRIVYHLSHIGGCCCCIKIRGWPLK